MWYSSASQNQHEQVPPNEIVATAESDLHTIAGEDVKSAEPSLSVKALGCSKANMASTGPGSEYWLP